ncbi:hypothetical protein EVAR_54611_1 [Eumeta japonica]|uniref:Uncharacterized protein n=1 Tax=Eumeta variegata TaxID=151549 RepID=A0A4C1YIM5_EUMVA|nr:hypothetical protein EVAR_54611_1 [Eumeta japonica]
MQAIQCTLSGPKRRFRTRQKEKTEGIGFDSDHGLSTNEFSMHEIKPLKSCLGKQVQPSFLDIVITSVAMVGSSQPAPNRSGGCELRTPQTEITGL